ncbi:MAG: RdgB/HAM1 family non-canonical purine NTP pyrophosphatase [Lysobacteraceae bacterium]
MKLILASHNTGKLAEFQQLLGGHGIQVVPQAALGIPDIEETGLSFAENALLKARHASQLGGMPALADDSGLCVDALGGAPGLYSARYAGSDGDAQANILKLLDALEQIPEDHRQAHFHCTLALLRHPADPAPLLCEGRWHGRILHEPRGEDGFGYDPVFFDDAIGCSAAELSREEKAAVSHRGQAIRQLLTMLARHPL